MSQKNVNIMSVSRTRKETLIHWALILAFVSGLILSILSSLDVCTDECTELKSYLIFGVPFAYFGIGFFTVLIFLQHYTQKNPGLHLIIGILISAALGAEIEFIRIQQKTGIWCQICLSIASLIAISGLLLIIGRIVQPIQKGQFMKKIKNLFGFLSITFIGFFAAIIGVSKPDHNLIAMNSMQQKIEFGNHNSPIVIYFVSDWFCNVCRQVEPVISKMAPMLMKQHGFYYIDKPVHRETINYSPYNLAFMVSDKPKYIEIRKALSQLSMSNNAPNDDAIRRAVSRTGATLQELNYGDVQAGLSFFNEIIKKYNVFGTPSLIIVNKQNNKMRLLSGEDDFTEAKINKALKEVS